MHRAPSPVEPPNRDLIDSLSRPEAFPEPPAGIEMIETHISWIILAGEFAYKIKKPLTLDFLDFGTLEKRKFFCEEELRLNSHWAPGLYVAVVPISLADGQAGFNDDGEIVEYAVQMRRFDQALRLDHQLEAGKLDAADMRDLASRIATCHAAAPAVDRRHRDRVLRLTRQLMLDNFTAIGEQLDDKLCASLLQWTESESGRLAAALGQRFDDGFVRDCHGDLHLGNLVRLPGGITAFDCIEFNADLRFIDTTCDIAFLVMDLEARRRPDLAAHFLNRYLENTGDYGAVAVLNLFFVYRCLVRAKVAVILASERETAADAKADIAEATSYCEMAALRSAKRRPSLLIMHGLSGSGKTWVSERLMASLPAIRIRSDRERKRVFELAQDASSNSPVGGGIYTPEANRRVYDRLFEATRTALAAGQDVIVDAAFLRRGQRKEARALAAELGAGFAIVDVTAAEDVLRRRITHRERTQADPSEAGIAVLEDQIAGSDDLSAEERDVVVTCDNSVSIDGEELVNKIRQLASS